MTYDPYDDRVEVDLRADGILWAINRVVFHPRGFALSAEYDNDGNLTGFTVIGPGDEPWRFNEDDDNTKFHDFEAMLARVLLAYQ